MRAAYLKAAFLTHPDSKDSAAGTTEAWQDVLAVKSCREINLIYMLYHSISFYHMLHHGTMLHITYTYKLYEIIIDVKDSRLFMIIVLIGERCERKIDRVSRD